MSEPSVTAGQVAMIVSLLTLVGAIAAVAVAWGRFGARVDGLTTALTQAMAELKALTERLQPLHLAASRTEEHHEGLETLRTQIRKIDRRLMDIEADRRAIARHDSIPILRPTDDDSDRNEQ